MLLVLNVEVDHVSKGQRNTEISAFVNWIDETLTHATANIALIEITGVVR